MIASLSAAGGGRRHDEHAEEIRGGGALLRARRRRDQTLDLAPAPSRAVSACPGAPRGCCRCGRTRSTASARRYAMRVAGADQACAPGRREGSSAGATELRVRGKRAETEVVARDGRLPRVHVDGEQAEDERDARETSASERAPVPTELLLMPRRPSQSSRPLKRSLPASRPTSRPTEQEQRPGLRCGDRRRVPLRRVREDARIDERACRRRARRTGAGRAARRRAARCAPGCARCGAAAPPARAVAWSAFESSRSLTSRIAPCFTCARFSARRAIFEAFADARAAHEGVPGRLAEDGRAAVVAERHEERNELEHRARRRVRRQQLVGRVGVHDQADRLVRVDDPAQRRRDARVDRAGDARRHVECDDAGARALREHRGPAGARGLGDDEEPARASPRARATSSRRTSEVRCAAPWRRGRSASGTATRRWTVGSPHDGILLRAARLFGELLDLFVLRRPRRPRELARDQVSSSARSTPSSPATRSNAFRCSVSSPVSCA